MTSSATSAITTRLRELLLYRAPLSAAEIAASLSISQATTSRALKQLAPDVATIGRARSARYALRRPVMTLGADFPIFLCRESGEFEHVADLTALYPKGFSIVSRDPACFTSRFYEDLPWWLTDSRPSGFLGRLIPKKFPELNFPEDVRLWSSDHCLYFWTMLAGDLVGNLIVGERAFTLAQATPSLPVVPHADRARQYEECADDMLALGPIGSSLAGEQPKFLIGKTANAASALVKFSPDTHTAIGKRRAELLVCEHLALETLRTNGLPAAKSSIVVGQKRIFLEVERFDRTEQGGRRGLVSLATVDAEFVGVAGNWRAVAKALLEARIISSESYRSILWRYYFGLCIANTDMHGGNLSFFIAGEHIGELAPVYDMLPMGLAPVNEELAPLLFLQPALIPSDREVWLSVLPVAMAFWQRVSAAPQIGEEIRSYAAQSIDFLRRQ